MTYREPYCPFLDAVTFNFKTNSQLKLSCIKHIGRQNVLLIVCVEKMNNNVLNFQMDLTDIIKNHLNMTYDCYLECTDVTFSIEYF